MKASRYILEWSLFPDMFALITALQIIIILKNTILKKNMQTLQISKFYQRNKKVLLFWLIVRDHLIISSHGEPGKPR